MRLILLSHIVLLLFGVSVAPVNAELKFCNKTPIELWTSVGYLKNGKWFSEGWWKSSPGSCKTPIGGNLTNRYYYHRTENKAFNKSWGGDNRFFCVHPTKVFGPTRHGNCPSGFNEAEFNTIDVGNRNSYTLNLTCPSCRNPDFRLSRGDLLVNYLHRDKIEGRNISFPATGRFSSSGSGSRFRVSYSISVGLSDLQDNIASMFRPKVNKSDDCGDVVRLQSVNLKPDSSGRARADVNIHYERWNCTYADFPETRCTDTWIKGPFGLKTKGIPNCSVTMKTRRTSKTRLIETGISGTLMLTPSVSNRNRVRLSGDVTNLRVRNDLARFIANSMNVDLRALAQNELEKNLGNGGAIQGAVPAELKPYFRIDSAKFYDRGGGELGVRATGTAEVTFSQIAGLCRKHTGFC